MDNLDRMNNAINVALLDKCISDMHTAKKAEMSVGLTDQAKMASRREAINSMESAIKYLRGDVALLTTADAKRAQELEEKEPEFMQVAEENEKLRKTLEKLEKKYGSKPASKRAKKAEEKTTSKKKQKKAKPKNKAKKPAKKKKKIAVKSKLTCPKCGRDFKSKAGLGRHIKSCKG